MEEHSIGLFISILLSAFFAAGWFYMWKRTLRLSLRLAQQEKRLQELTNPTEESLQPNGKLLQPHLITSNEERLFRNNFNALYPQALLRLRTFYPQATRTEELLCMLILFKQSNEEIAYTLGISRTSVVKIRYRLRSKLNLPEGSKLNDQIVKIMTT